MFVLKGILRAESQEKILLYLLVRERGYGKGIADFYGIALTPVQKQLQRLEDDGVVASQPLGGMRQFRLNPRYPFIAPLKELLKQALASYPTDLARELAMDRRRPRKAGKAVNLVRETKS
ncbi:winged helix-turn-helix transcriptional regulator [Exilibacterium tricleocarpae]|uniref:Winged helix-turn-helix transcriptional regulator n=1 Tax=Exilibacterium tricleocarpae TaxID=2591008 RepID=A0A545TBB6_9GAMM|nr:winged helix-turn-helix domain-containing protein [Exilibacterium tricleocarpae]TQV74508.1 winged helix-turn-helix transcriptional regulator [Exilibacterium tricleocarpae]